MPTNYVVDNWKSMKNRTSCQEKCNSDQSKNHVLLLRHKQKKTRKTPFEL